MYERLESFQELLPISAVIAAGGFACTLISYQFVLWDLEIEMMSASVAQIILP